MNDSEEQEKLAEERRTKADARRSRARERRRLRKSIKNKIRRWVPRAAIMLAVVALALIGLAFLRKGANEEKETTRQKTLVAQAIEEKQAKRKKDGKLSTGPAPQPVPFEPETRTISSSAVAAESELGKVAPTHSARQTNEATLKVSKELREKLEHDETETGVTQSDWSGALPFLRKVNKAVSIDDLAALARNPAGAKRFIQDWIDKGNPMPKIHPQKRLQAQPIHPNAIPGVAPSRGGEFIEVTALLENFEEAVFYIEKRGEEFALDWNGYTGQNSLSFSRFLSSPPLGTQQFRILGGRSTNYDDPRFPFEKYRAIQLIEPAGNETMTGYIPRENKDLEVLLRTMNLDKGGFWRATLKVSYPLNSPQGSRSVLVETLVSPTWLVP